MEMLWKLLGIPHKAPVWVSCWWPMARGPGRSPVWLARALAEQIRPRRADSPPSGREKNISPRFASILLLIVSFHLLV